MRNHKTWSRHRSYEEIKKLCAKNAVPLHDELYLERGFDTVLVGEKHGGYVIYNTWNGRFFGKTPDGKDFTSDNHHYDRAAWMQSLLKFFYVD